MKIGLYLDHFSPPNFMNSIMKLRAFEWGGLKTTKSNSTSVLICLTRLVLLPTASLFNRKWENLDRHPWQSLALLLTCFVLATENK